jgi:Fur family transcriptional regulator, ferric uptake regulator
MAKSAKDKDKQIDQKLRAAGLKVTQARLSILSILSQKHGPFSADEIYQLVHASKKTAAIDKVTVYRCLTKFEELGLVSACDFGDGTARYEIKHEDHHHHHLICRICKRIEEIPLCPMDDIPLRLPKTGYKDISHRLEFFGICPKCSE